MKVQQVSAKRQHWVDPKRWAANVHSMASKLQAVRRHTLEASKDRDSQLARRVVAAAVIAVPVQLHSRPVYGFKEQEAQLVAELVVPTSDWRGLWLHGCGK